MPKKTKPRKTRSLARRWLGRLAKLALAFALLSILPILSLRWLEPPTSSFMALRKLESPAVKIQWNPVTLDRISPWLGLAVIAAEDQRFAEHHGVDLAAIDKALTERRNGQRFRGASTITQQLAKNLFLWSGASWPRKGLEAWLALWTDALLSKQRILELYLNVVEFGDGIYGAEAAARYYFGKPATALTAREAALLAALLPSPKRYQIKPPTPFMNERADWIMQQGRQLGGPALVETLP